jgi:Phosphoribosylanthranilate isomerase
MKVKICGLSNLEQVETCIKYNADFCGFILNYPKSHRFISYEKAIELTNIKKKNTQYVGVLVNPSEEELNRYSKLNIDYFQIYGDFSEKNLEKIKSKYKKKIIFAIQVKSKEDISKYKLIQKEADIIFV